MKYLLATTVKRFLITILEAPKKSIAFVDSTGRVQVLNSDINAPYSLGVLYVGKFQYMRARFTTLDKVCVENVPVGAELAVEVLTTLNGKSVVQTKSGYLKESSGLYREYLVHTTGMNHTLRFTGNFNLVGLILGFHNSGVR